MVTRSPLSAQTGDILFYRGDTSSAFDKVLRYAIRAFTHSMYAHVAIAVSSTEKIEAIQIGIVKTPLVSYDAMWRFTLDPTLFSQKRFDEALTWLQTMLGSGYSYLDFCASVVYKFEDRFSFDLSTHYDCSSLAATFLQKAGVDLNEDSHMITPAKLAQLLGVK